MRIITNKNFLRFSWQSLRTSRSGFGLVEVIVSLALLVLIAVAVSSLARVALHSAVSSENRTKAYNFLQEGFEEFRNIRDKNWLDSSSSTSWDSISGCSSFPCTLNKTQTIDNLTFTRRSTVTKVSNDKMKIEIIVSWTEPGTGARKITARSYLTNWRTI